MSRAQQLSLFTLRLAMGWLFFYAGITKLLDPAWTAAGYLAGAKTFPALYQAMASPALLPVINFLNAWGLTLIGLALLLGVMVRLGAWAGALIMVLYYIPVLDFPYVGTNAFLVDQHIIYALALLVLASWRAGRVWGLETWCAQLPICRRYPKVRWWLG